MTRRKQLVLAVKQEVDVTDDFVWAAFIGLVLTRAWGQGGLALAVGFVASIVVLRDLGSRPMRALVAAAAIELAVLAAGDGPNVLIGMVIISAAAVFRNRGDIRDPRKSIPVLLILTTIAVVPWAFDFRSSAIFEGAGRDSSPITALLLLLVAADLREEVNFVGGLLRGASEREEQARAEAVAEERARIARDLHDIVAHQMSVVVTQAQGAAAIVDTDPDRARRALETIATTAREGLVEMRRLVDVDRARGGPTEVQQPQPGLSYDDYARLAEGAEAAGLQDVHLNLEAERDTNVSPAIAMSAYRLSQEAITNAAKHSPGASLAVVAKHTGGVLRIDVTNGPGVRRAADIPGTGLGLIGMRERVEFFGGTLETGPTADGGWSVTATFPTLEAPPTTS
jgi:signal transduction histidine kinase